MKMCKIDIEENEECQKCCKECDEPCEKKCIIAKFAYRSVCNWQVEPNK